MTYIVERNTRFYVVAYDGLDPFTGRERRRWIPIGHDRTEAEAVVARLDSEHDAGPPPRHFVTVGEFLTRTWMPNKRRHVHTLQPPTATRGSSSATSTQRSATSRCAGSGGSSRQPLRTAPPRPAAAQEPGSLQDDRRGPHDHAGRARRCRSRELVSRNVAHHVRSRARPPAQAAARSWTAIELNQFLKTPRSQRPYPALHLAAPTGMRHGEVVGPKWSDLHSPRSRLSISRSLQNVGGRPIEFGVKTRTSRRTVELNHNTCDLLVRWRRRLQQRPAAARRR